MRISVFEKTGSSYDDFRDCPGTPPLQDTTRNKRPLAYEDDMVTIDLGHLAGSPRRKLPSRRSAPLHPMHHTAHEISAAMPVATRDLARSSSQIDALDHPQTLPMSPELNASLSRLPLDILRRIDRIYHRHATNIPLRPRDGNAYAAYLCRLADTLPLDDAFRAWKNVAIRAHTLTSDAHRSSVFTALLAAHARHERPEGYAVLRDLIGLCEGSGTRHRLCVRMLRKMHEPASTTVLEQHANACVALCERAFAYEGGDLEAAGRIIHSAVWSAPEAILARSGQALSELARRINEGRNRNEVLARLAPFVPAETPEARVTDGDR